MTETRPKKPVDVESAKKKLERALRGDLPRARKPTKKQSIQELRPQIVALRDKGYSWAEIAELLKDDGCGNKDTLRYAMTSKTVKKKRGIKATVTADASGEEKTGLAADSGGKVAEKPETKPGKNERSTHAAQRRATWKA